MVVENQRVYLLRGTEKLIISKPLKENSFSLRLGQTLIIIGDITQATLTKQLRMLEDYVLINRHVYSEIPPKVEYSLTGLGKEFKPVLEQFRIWGDKYIESLKNK